MTVGIKKQLRQLVMQGLILTNYNWSDVENGQIKDLSFEYKTHKGHSGTIDLDDIEIDMYMDCGDVCVDTMDNLYVLEEDGIENNFEDFQDDDPNIKLTEIPKIETEFDWYDFYQEIMDYYED